jgi:hypothetical protein
MQLVPVSYAENLIAVRTNCSLASHQAAVEKCCAVPMFDGASFAALLSASCSVVKGIVAGAML